MHQKWTHQDESNRGSWLRIVAPAAPVKVRGRAPARDIPHWVLIENEDGKVQLTQVRLLSWLIWGCFFKL